MAKGKIITRSIFIIGLISLFNDISSEMLYPIMPVYLKSIGFGALAIGILEGFAEATAGLSKGYFGKLSDVKGVRIPFIRFGYIMSSLAKPMLALFTYTYWVFTARFMDKLGKGVRSSARDALLSSLTTKEHKGKVFGFRQAMDTIGAAIGPVLALVYLYYYPGHYKTLFIIAFSPALVGVTLTFFIKEKKHDQQKHSTNKSTFSVLNPFAFIDYWKTSSTEFKKITLGFLAFTLINSTDMLLLLMAKSTGISDQDVIGVYIFYNVIFAMASYPIGAMADKIGMKTTFIIGLILFSIVYFGMANLSSPTMLYALFFLYGIYAAASDGITKAWIANITPHSETATAVGFFTGLSSICTLLASALAGLLWVQFYPQLTFMVSAIGGVLIIIYFLVLPKNISNDGAA
ncbi:MAG: MFS transporter [Bacteroidota bacterium]